jgi:hypothetical protein
MHPVARHEFLNSDLCFAQQGGEACKDRAQHGQLGCWRSCPEFGARLGAGMLSATVFQRVSLHSTSRMPDCINRGTSCGRTECRGKPTELCLANCESSHLLSGLRQPAGINSCSLGLAATGKFPMSSPSIISLAIIVWLSTAAVDPVNAKGTFRLQGAWPSSFAHNQANENRRLHRFGSEQLAHAPRGNHH